MTCALAPTYDTSRLTIENMIAHIRALPKMSEETVRILTIIQENLPGQTTQTEFTKAKILRKITKFTASAERFQNLQDNECLDRSKAAGRAVLNATCLGLAGLSGFIPTGIGRLFWAVIFSSSYAGVGVHNRYLENQRLDDESPREKWIAVFQGIFCGPCFAAKEAIFTIPERIMKAQTEAASYQNEIISDFGGIVALGQYQENTNPLREALNARISELSAKIDEFAISARCLDPSRLRMSQTTKTLLENAASEATRQQQRLTQELRASQTALAELDALISCIRQRILTNSEGGTGTLVNLEVVNPSLLRSEMPVAGATSINRS